MVRCNSLLAVVMLAAGAWCQDFSDIKVEKVAGGYTFTDSPLWAKEGFLLWSDVPSNRIMKLAYGEKTVPFRENTAGATGITYDAKGNLYACEARGRRVIRIDKKGVVEVLAENWEGKKLNAPNDIVVRKDGHAYFTDPAFGAQIKTRELDFHGIYHIPPKGPLELVAKWKGRPNGITLSPTGKVLYVSNTDERTVTAFDIDNKGAASNERVFLSKIDGAPDGIRADEKGNLYVTARQLLVFSPEGKQIHAIEMSETPRNLTFGDPDFQTLYVTALSSVYRVRLNVKGAMQY